LGLLYRPAQAEATQWLSLLPRVRGFSKSSMLVVCPQRAGKDVRRPRTRLPVRGVRSLDYALRRWIRNRLRRRREVSHAPWLRHHLAGRVRTPRGQRV